MSSRKFVGRSVAVAVIDPESPHQKGPKQGWTRR
jgi:hypothetical protein